MSFQHRIVHEERRMYARIEGPVTITDIRHHLDVERREGGLAYIELIDARQATASLSAADVRSIVSWLRDFAREVKLGPTAVVVSTPVAYGMMRMLDILVEEFCVVRPFLEIEEAESWIHDSFPQ